MAADQIETVIVTFNGSDRLVTFTLTTSYFDSTRTNVIYNCTGVDNAGGTYTAIGSYVNFIFTPTNVIKTN